MSHLQSLSRITRAAALATALASPALAAEVRGTVALPADGAVPPVGYSQTRVAAPAASVRYGRADAALFLKSVKSGVLPAPATKPQLKVAGMRLEPSVIACAVDEAVEITNGEKHAVTLSIGSDALPALAPGATTSYVCHNAGPQKVRISELPHVRGLAYVGEVGVSGVPGPDGKFTLVAPDGEFKLGVIGLDGLLTEVPVTIAGAPVELGKLEPKGAVPDAPAAVGQKNGNPPKAPAARPKPAGDEINLEP